MLHEKISYLEKQFSKSSYSIPIELPIGDTEQVNMSWNLINESSQNYAELLQTYDIAEVAKSFVQRNKKSKDIAILPKPGNLDIKDKYVNFHDFYAELEATKHTYEKGDLSKATLDEMTIIREKCEPVINYIISGNHSSANKQFQGWAASISKAKKYNKKQLIGIISIDLPSYVSHKKYKCSGTQHYVAFLFDIVLNKLYIFDSASKNPLNDHSEIVYILKYTFEKLFGDNIVAEGLVFRNVLQPGAGDQKDEDPHSYNNQNVFCHTWSLWFCLVMICFYDTVMHDHVMKFIRSLSHRNPILNLIMVKRFAGWLTVYLDDEDRKDASKKFAEKAYVRAKEKGDEKRLIEVLEMYTLAKDPYVGLNYVYAYKEKKYVSIEWVCRVRKVKMDIDLLEHMDHIDINAYLQKSKEIRCPVGWKLYEPTKRCRKH